MTDDEIDRALSKHYAPMFAQLAADGVSLDDEAKNTVIDLIMSVGPIGRTTPRKRLDRQSSAVLSKWIEETERVMAFAFTQSQDPLLARTTARNAPERALRRRLNLLRRFHETVAFSDRKPGKTDLPWRHTAELAMHLGVSRAQAVRAIVAFAKAHGFTINAQTLENVVSRKAPSLK